MCYVVVVPTVVCARNHVEKCEFAWRQCAEKSRRMEVEAICDDPEQGIPPIIDVRDMPTRFYFLTQVCQICAVTSTNSHMQNLVHRKLELEARLSDLNQKVHVLGEQYRTDRTLDAQVKEWQERALERAEREREAVFHRLQDHVATITTAENAIYAPRLRAIYDELQEITNDEDGGINHIYLGPVSHTEAEHNPPHRLPTSYSIEHLDKALYEIGSGGWLHPDGSVRLPIKPIPYTL